ncbi:8-oxo-dGTP diphosphatase [Paenibacillus sp. GCM10027626]|uniref:8-oxo-dGTP diphosphatase n=1 Tax=Paenibacillus sp. GCM10027626 TaxID=3273411 RepID=UPI0036411A52
MSKVEMTNMCMIYDKETDRVLVQERIKSWKGITFPGGHVENGESIADSTIREVKEETGLDVSDLELCGIVHWYNNETDETYLVFSYRTTVFRGKLMEETEEGRHFWVDKNELASLALAPGFGERLPMFFGDKFAEGFGVWNDNCKEAMVWK